jgi:hypothetical protein
MIEDKIRMYAFVLYYLNELRFKFQIISSHLSKPQEEDGYLYISDKNKDEWKPLVEAIDNKLREQPHLVSPQIHKKWVEVKSLFFDPKSKKAISELRKMLADEGNRIVKKYLKYTAYHVLVTPILVFYGATIPTLLYQSQAPFLLKRGHQQYLNSG